MPLILVVLVALEFAWFKVYSNVLLRKHDTDIALSIMASADLLSAAYQEDLSGLSTRNSDAINYTLRRLSQTPGVSCVSIDGENVQASYPPPAFCSNLVIRDTAKASIDDQHFLVFHLNEKYLDEIKSEAILYSSVLLFASFSAFMLFNYLGYKNVASVRIGELLKANNLFFKYNPTPTAEIYADGTIGSTSLSWNDFFGDSSLEKTHFRSLVSEPSRATLDTVLKEHFDSAKTVTRAQISVTRLDGHTLSVQAQLSSASQSGEKSFLSISDIDKIKKIADLRTEQALRDELTGAGSRRAFHEFFDRCTDPRGYFCFLLDIDDFKSVNSLYGHQIGDLYLQTFVKDFIELLQGEPQIYRIGGEEFVFVVKAEKLTEAIREKIHKLQSNKIETEGKSINRTFSAGCTFFQPNEAVSLVLRRCDLYLTRAKQLGKARIIDDSYDFIFDDHAPATILDAIEREAISYFFQPIFSQHQGAPIGCEALIRWQCEDTVLPPNSFIESYYKATNLRADENLRNKLFFSYLADLCTTQLIYVTYNIMSSDLRPESVRSLINYYAPVKETISVILEISETNMELSDLEKPIGNILKQLKDAGFKIALDDFGKENSNFQRLIEWDIDILKLDRSLVSNIHENSKKFLSVKAISSLAKEFGISVVAEGVETADEANTLTKLGIDTRQGYYYGRPMDKSCFLNFMSHANDVKPTPRPSS